MTTVNSTDNKHDALKAPVSGTSNGNVSPKVQELLDRYDTCVKERSKSFIELGKVMAAAQSTLDPEDLESFHKRVGVDQDSPAIDKLILIGNKAKRFQPYLDRLPAAVTTMHRLAKLTEKSFMTVIGSDDFSPFVTRKRINEIVRSNTTRTSKKAT